MTVSRVFLLILLIVSLPLLLLGCASTSSTMTTAQPDGAESAASTSSNGDSHSSDSEPNYEVVFPQESVNRIDIVLSGEAWTALQTEMEEQFGQQGEGGFDGPGGMMGRQPPNGQPPSQGDLPQPPEGFQPGELPEGGLPGNRPGGGMGGFDFGDTSYVTSTVTFNGETWNSVGFRYSGNSTLQTSWRSGTKKISFRLDFDQFEDQDPSTEDQRFYGFKQLSFKSNAMDDSYLREKVAGDLFRDAGVIAPETAFYAVYVDYGEGSQYFGLYTAVEIVDDTLIQTAFSDDSGNVYKPEGQGAAFVEGTFDEESFEKQTNEEAADWSDIESVFAALHSDLRTSDPEAWRAGLESVFDVDSFIRWLAVDTIMQNWDTYGAMAHNYYLYTDPADGLVTWIPWDNNMSLSAGGLGMNEGGAAPGWGGGGRGGPGRGARDLDLSTVGESWPLIRYLMDDPTYQAKYEQYLQETIEGNFQPDTLAATYQKYHDLIAPYVEKETEDATQIESIERFHQATEELIQHAQERYDAVLMYLAGN